MTAARPGLALALLLVAGCEKRPAPPTRPTDSASASSASQPLASAPSATPSVSAGLPAPSATNAAPPATIECGKGTCVAGRELCCNFYDKSVKTCKPAPSVQTEASLWAACGAAPYVVAAVCDDSGDCPGETLCAAPVRHGSGADKGTFECLPKAELDGPERCANLAGCKQPGFVCRKDRLCHPPTKK